ncbi:uncharacterized protein LOC133818669 isoform X1 [Humulus lupulus]|uniref:uncharacterized protein LOC133818669 isoform X1 n=1 Tax=Humulus lupulus TaxID=3486 RepID=UPI002B40CFE2|nr:uncharacterized protein LOC133818669 isoform X1 [Humulus lupulus]XP_062107670.1 uncharacterized protein LOC133818669 isoform X1 [Humulus lupulus]
MDPSSNILEVSSMLSEVTLALKYEAINALPLNAVSLDGSRSTYVSTMSQGSDISLLTRKRGYVSSLPGDSFDTIVHFSPSKRDKVSFAPSFLSDRVFLSPTPPIDFGFSDHSQILASLGVLAFDVGVSIGECTGVSEGKSTEFLSSFVSSTVVITSFANTSVLPCPKIECKSSRIYEALLQHLMTSSIDVPVFCPSELSNGSIEEAIFNPFDLSLSQDPVGEFIGSHRLSVATFSFDFGLALVTSLSDFTTVTTGALLSAASTDKSLLPPVFTNSEVELVTIVTSKDLDAIVINVSGANIGDSVGPLMINSSACDHPVVVGSRTEVSASLTVPVSSQGVLPLVVSASIVESLGSQSFLLREVLPVVWDLSLG